MTRWFVLEHPSRSTHFVPEGTSWGFFFLGSLWAMVQGNWGLCGWWLLWTLPLAVGVAAFEPPQEVRLLAFGVTLLLRLWFTVWFWEKKKVDLLDRGWQEKAVLEGPTRDFVEAEWHRRGRK